MPVSVTAVTAAPSAPWMSLVSTLPVRVTAFSLAVPALLSAIASATSSVMSIVTVTLASVSPSDTVTLKLLDSVPSRSAVRLVSVNA